MILLVFQTYQAPGFLPQDYASLKMCFCLNDSVLRIIPNITRVNLLPPLFSILLLLLPFYAHLDVPLHGT